jgi:ubiquinone/menaquinone biosynthesis C-methylase UbiE
VKSNTEWIDWGNRDPLFATAAWPGHERAGSHPWTDEEFYGLGRSDWADFLAHWKAYGLDSSACIEIGCGPGRLTRYLATTFDHVDAIDVSRDMVAYASANMRGAQNVTFHITDGTRIPVRDASATSVFSAHVFQHFDSLADAAEYFRETARVLVPGGSLMIHLPIHKFPSRGTLLLLFRALYQARLFAGSLRAWYMRRRIRAGKKTTLMRGLSYEMHWLTSVLTAMGFEQVEFVVFPMQSNQDLHPCVLARKRATPT